jgi:hypothetical protein
MTAHPHSAAPLRLSRRQILQWFTAAGALISSEGFSPSAYAATDSSYIRPGHGTPTPQGYGTDPVLNKNYKSGDFWPLTLDDLQRRNATTLADIILPADDLGPAASSVGVIEFIDEWVSAPYPEQKADRPILIDGLQWLEAQSQQRHQLSFHSLSSAQQTRILDDICVQPTPPALEAAHRFFDRFRSVASGGYYSTLPGWAAIGFIGNQTLPAFSGPPAEVLALVGVEQTVK